jgi:glycosyltransferase involved in cell wall biosynthesis
MISKVRVGNHLEQYKKLKVPETFNYRIAYICNGIKLPIEPIVKDYTTPLNVLYVGRGTPEKRVHLFAKIAEQVKQQNAAINFIIAGDVANAIPENLQPYSELKGNIHDAKQLADLYKQAHVLLITSNTEGFPMVVMEAMAYGCAIIATPVGDLSVHVQKENGFITSGIDEENVVDEMTQFILQLSTDRTLLETFGKQNIDYAQKHFDIELFSKKYQELIC